LKKQTIIYFTNDDPPSVLNDLAVNRSLEDWQAGGGFAFSAVACCLLPIAYGSQTSPSTRSPSALA